MLDPNGAYVLIDLDTAVTYSAFKNEPNISNSLVPFFLSRMAKEQN